MFKKIIFILLLLIIIVFTGVRIYNLQYTAECWWGVMFPCLSFIPENEDKNEINSVQISSLNDNYIFLEEEKPVKIKIAIWEWFKEKF